MGVSRGRGHIRVPDPAVLADRTCDKKDNRAAAVGKTGTIIVEYTRQNYSYFVEYTRQKEAA